MLVQHELSLCQQFSSYFTPLEAQLKNLSTPTVQPHWESLEGGQAFTFHKYHSYSEFCNVFWKVWRF